jgi:hypothetical protein
MGMIEIGSTAAVSVGRSASWQLPSSLRALARPCYEFARFGLYVVTETVAPGTRRGLVWQGYEWTMVELDTIAARLLDDPAAADRAEPMRNRATEEVQAPAELGARVIDLDAARRRHSHREGTARSVHNRRVHDAQIAAHRHPSHAGGV